MELLRRLSRLQDEHGCLSDETLRQVSRQENIPLYHLEGLRSFYPHFTQETETGPRTFVCGDVCCAMRRDPDPAQQSDRTASDWEEVSCLGRCDTAPAMTVGGHIEIPEVVRRTHTARFQESQLGQIEPYATVRSLVVAGEEIAQSTISPLTDAGLRGMGGAGFPTGQKWQLVADATLNDPPVVSRFIKDDVAYRPQKYVICNADESEPGTFKDREILAQLPHLVIEGLLLAGLTIGAERGIVFIRHEYEPELQRLEVAINEAREAGILGDDAAGSGNRFDIDVFVSPGGYILGEETALLECLEDRRGEPRNKPPYPGQRGLYAQPTLINNVETYALATSIIHHGADWWRQQGAGDFHGLKYVCISGDVTEPGVFETPVGTTVTELIKRAGGIRDGQSLQAFLPGGASSNFLPASAVDTPLDFDAVRQAGSMLGTGAVIVFDESRDLMAMATNLVRFFRNESCGKCVPCRIGSQRAVELLEACDVNDIDVRQQLISLNETLEQTSICGLGQVALHPVTSLISMGPGDGMGCPLGEVTNDK